jgi:sulfite exporter TauE/SafE/copper chaperone CopZ
MTYKTLKVKVSGLHCKACELLSEEKLSALPGVKAARVSHSRGEAEIDYQETAPDKELIQKELRAIGYDLAEDGQKKDQSRKGKWKELFLALIITLVLAFLLTKSGWLNLQDQMNPEALSLGGIWLIGLIAGISTCMALIGGIVMALSADYSRRHPQAPKIQKFLPHLYFNLGRAAGFFILGGLLGSLGAAFKISALANAWLSLFIGLLIIFLGLQILDIFPWLNRFSLTLPKSLGKIMPNKENSQNPLGIMLAGALTFFLPCGFTQSMQIYALSTGSFWQGGIVMFMFALGTSLGLLSLGGLVSSIQGKKHSLFLKIAGLIVILFGLFNITNAQKVLSLHNNNNVEVKQNGQNFDEKEVQIINMEQAGRGYIPNSLQVEVNRPVRWVINSTNPYSCASSLVVPSLKINKRLELGENIIEFTPTQTGTIRFACSMGMYTGVIEVIKK